MLTQNLYSNIKESDIFFILGPCVFDNRDNALIIAERVKQLKDKYNKVFIFKASFDKANRQSIESYRGLGIDKSLKLLAEIKGKFNLPVLTDIHESYQADLVKDVVDLIQIPAFLSRQTDLLISAGKTGRIVNIKKGQFMSAYQMILSAKKVEATGNSNILLTERGTFMGYGDLVVDFRNIFEMKKMSYPVVFDATHSVQRLNANSSVSGGNREYVQPLAYASMSFGADGVFMEVHPEPDKALCDGANSVNLDMMDKIVAGLIKLKQVNRDLNKNE